MESEARASKRHCSFSNPSHTYRATMRQRGLPYPGKYLGSTRCNVTGVPRQRNMAQIKEQVKTPEKELSDEEIDNQSVAEFKTLVMRMLTEMVEYGPKIEEKLKAMQSEIKRTKSKGKETRA